MNTLVKQLIYEAQKRSRKPAPATEIEFLMLSYRRDLDTAPCAQLETTVIKAIKDHKAFTKNDLNMVADWMKRIA